MRQDGALQGCNAAGGVVFEKASSSSLPTAGLTPRASARRSRSHWLRAWRLAEARWGWLARAGLAAELIDVMLVLNAKQRKRLAACRPGGAGATRGAAPRPVGRPCAWALGGEMGGQPCA